jgi:hypothetical protein
MPRSSMPRSNLNVLYETTNGSIYLLGMFSTYLHYAACAFAFVGARGRGPWPRAGACVSAYYRTGGGSREAEGKSEFYFQMQNYHGHMSRVLPRRLSLALITVA